MDNLYEALGMTPPTEEELAELLKCECGHYRYRDGSIQDVTKPCPCGREGCYNFHCENCDKVGSGFGPVGCTWDGN